ncbi:GntR family transcriptional regulator [Bittarella massiliensis (ex Durand et al. 2017)]|uniref:GntR family transcriptional regulator n=1 Tax=Bittarella massiliensis (ex Durand et al. 2017) TaxID=1720313 RepID=UPI001AA17B08|nr:GntR family transcriptional regulator [Bittarella massiliensis (ex Durand et al. 2017)]MBO1678511.1 GntR family transcriptional regulator [Bittarella massiliensis (ex Durand et al. 2017)]
MGAEMELQQMIYDTLLTQIQFGTFVYMDSLPATAEVGEHFHVSVDTVQLAYRRLKREGYISLAKNVGARVLVSFTEEEIEQHIQTFFALRKDALLDLDGSFGLLFGRIWWLGLKHAPPETLDKIERLYQKHAQQPYALWQYYEQKYVSLGNAMLTRLARQFFLFFQAPFFSAAEYRHTLGEGARRVQETLKLCREKDWQALQSLLCSYQNDLSASLHRFYRERVTLPAPEEQVAFYWNSYKKPGQLCYSLAMELLIAISRGVYPAGSLLPTMERLSEEKEISMRTVRRAVGLLCNIGAVKSDRPYGMRVLPILESIHNCDFTQPPIRQRLLDMLESLQIFALSCGAVAERALRSLDPDSMGLWRQRLSAIKGMPYYDVLTYTVLALITDSIPNRTVHTVYSELLQQLFWGNPLRGMKGDRETTNALLEPYLAGLISCLENQDIPGFCGKLEQMLLYELGDSRDHLLQLGIKEAKNILVPERDEW